MTQSKIRRELISEWKALIPAIHRWKLSSKPRVSYEQLSQFHMQGLRPLLGSRLHCVFESGEQHLKGKSLSRASTPLGAHRIQKHSAGDFQVKVSILAYEAEIAARKTLEVLWIRAKVPAMNRRDECLPVTNELAPYLGLCHL